MTEAARFAFDDAPSDAALAAPARDPLAALPSASPSAPARAASTGVATSPQIDASTRRPEPGLARGVWEAPRWSFFVAAAAVVVLAALYAARRAGLLRRRPRA